MNKNLLIGLFTLICSVFAFTACSDDDEGNNNGKLPNEEVAGTYKGTLDVKLDGSTIITAMPKNVTITKAGDNAINMGLKDFSFGEMNLGDIELSNCALTGQDGNYRFSGSQSLTLADPIGTCEAVTEGSIINGTATININIDVPALGQTVEVVYTGTKMTGNESSEAKILSFIFDRNVAAVDSLVLGEPVINEEAKTITFRVADSTTTEYLKQLVPTIEISENATITPEGGIAQDFNEPVQYTVTAEDGTQAVYTVSVLGSYYDFEDWVVENETYNFQKPTNWSTSNAGIAMIKGMNLYSGDAIVSPEESGYQGKGAKVMTAYTTGRDMFIAKVPVITSGSLFTGEFKITDLTNTLKSTQFGIPYFQKPTNVKGYFKYTPGKDYYYCPDPKNNAHIASIDPDKADECSLCAVLYEVEDYSDFLHGENIYTSDQIVAIAQQFAGNTPDYTAFDLQLEYKKEYDPTKKYRFAIIFSSSKDGAAFSGAEGSTLWIDEVEVINE